MVIAENCSKKGQYIDIDRSCNVRGSPQSAASLPKDSLSALTTPKQLGAGKDGGDDSRVDDELFAGRWLSQGKGSDKTISGIRRSFVQEMGKCSVLSGAARKGSGEQSCTYGHAPHRAVRSAESPRTGTACPNPHYFMCHGTSKKFLIISFSVPPCMPLPKRDSLTSGTSTIWLRVGESHHLIHL